MELSLDDIKQELKDYFSNQTIINEYEKSNGKIEELYERATKITPTLSDMPKGSGKVNDKAAECIVEYVDLQQANIELEKDIEEKSKIDENFVGYFTNEDGKQTPAPLVANMFEYGSKDRKYPKHPFFRKSFRKAQIEKAMLDVQKKYIKEG